jgi:hypothetical protein
MHRHAWDQNNHQDNEGHGSLSFHSRRARICSALGCVTFLVKARACCVVLSWVLRFLLILQVICNLQRNQYISLHYDSHTEYEPKAEDRQAQVISNLSTDSYNIEGV